jgi:hypothetical protein
MRSFRPFADESESIGIGGLTVENRLDRVSVYGSLDMTRDREGLANARVLKALIDRVVRALEAERDLPEKIAPPLAPAKVKNPFT